MTSTLAVLLSGRLIGQVERTRAGVLRLTYLPEASTPGATPLSLSLPPTEQSITGPRVQSFLDGLLPDNSRVRQSIAQVHGADASDPLSLLAAIGKDCAGAVQFCPPDQVEQALARTGDLVPVRDSDIEMRLAEIRMDQDASWTMSEEHWSLGGGQQKFALRRTDDGWAEARGTQPTSHIFKPGIYKLRAQALVEHISMRAARAIGLDVAHTEYTSFKSEDALVITRFDRVASPDGTLARVHQEDACQALGVVEKYEQHGGPRVEDVVTLLRQNSHTAAVGRRNVYRFIDGIILNTVIAAPDGHARNYALLLDGDQVSLAPLFDVASGLAYSNPSNRVTAMSVAGNFYPETVTRDDWARLAERNRLDEAALIDRVNEVADQIPDAMRDALDEIDDWDGQSSELAKRLLPAMQEHATRVAQRMRSESTPREPVAPPIPNDGLDYGSAQRSHNGPATATRPYTKKDGTRVKGSRRTPGQNRGN
ncbi:HipA N-terminal domain protein [Xylanimonas cellulosilytica DSM 15894]|uniref:HipA N-terminal domain protein n=1 Tax=Xylanimonas cellulosilytica (strain DSM 15894 / JCM 12276 / CECT 5975 / KCTC 9989 / LMG 20990 / NBRC 107835 / XIL07) TaxID=446471 RepID=D1C066_XYLCX|nr:type II toxin-antitoxin system HipA family toxin [Xylanimonas cellulosilytica]ACZ30255.1 HipA N-terminal domain protein [Xylanimonas cellulosilytica DSM 15894]